MMIILRYHSSLNLKERNFDQNPFSNLASVPLGMLGLTVCAQTVWKALIDRSLEVVVARGQCQYTWILLDHFPGPVQDFHCQRRSRGKQFPKLSPS